MRAVIACTLALVSALWLGLAHAQMDAAERVALAEAGARLPLASAGTVLRWAPEVDEVFFDLPDTSWVRLSIYSPSIDLDEVGDERYDDRPLEALFELTDGAGERLAHERYSLAPSGWVTLFDGLAREGLHVLRSQVLGHGKNVYLLQLETEFPDVALHGEQLTVNVSRRDWHPALVFPVDTSARCELGMYDGDGDDELEAVLVLPSGDRVRPPVSDDLAWSMQPLPRLQGLYTVLVRIPEQAFQGTNAVRFELRCGGERVALPLVPPVTLEAPAPGDIAVEVVDLQGRPVDIGYAIEGRYDRLVTLDDDDRYELVSIDTRGGAIEGARSVAFGPDGGFVRFVVDRAAQPAAMPVPVPDVRAELAPPLRVAVPLPLPRPAAVLAPHAAVLELGRVTSPDALLPCEPATVLLSVRNVGAQPTPYALRELVSAGLLLERVVLDAAHALTWNGALEPGDGVEHSYVLRMGAGEADTFALRADVDWLGASLADDGEVLRVVIEIELTLVPADRTLYADDTFVVEARLRNPLERDVRLWLTPTVSSRALLREGPALLDLPAGGEAVARFTLEGREAGAAAFQLNAHACDPAGGDVPSAGPPAALRVTLEAVPELPTPTLSTLVTVDLAARRLPVLDGLVVVSRLPEGARYQPGSSSVDGERVDDPRQVDGALVFDLAGRAVAQVSYTVLHDDAIVTSDADHALIARTPHPEVLIGDPTALELYQREAPTVVERVDRERIGTLIQEPADGAVVRSGASTRVSVDADLAHDVRLLVNGERVGDDRVAQRTLDNGLGRQTLDYIGVPLRAGPNTLRVESEAGGVVESDEVTVFLAGAPVAIGITPLTPLVADTVAPLRIEILVSDAWGVAPRDSYVTVDVAGGAIASRDADPQQAGHQVAFRDGRGVFELAPFGGSGRVTITAAVGLAVAEARFDVAAQPRPWIVNGIASAGVHVGDGLRFGVSGSVFARGTVFGDALLTLAAQAPLEPLGPQGDPYERFPVTGSSGEQAADAQSRHGVYARLERGQDFVQYGDFVAAFDGGLQTTRAYTGLSGAWAGESGFGVRAYAAYVPVRDLVTGLELPSDGTSAYRLPHAPLRPGTLRLEVVKRDRIDGRLVLDDGDPLLRTLVSPADYAVDEAVALVLLTRPLPIADAAGNPYALRASYQLRDLDDAPAYAQVGAQLRYELGGVTLRAGVTQETRGVDAFERLASAGAAVDLGALTADFDVGIGSDETSGGLGVALGVRFADGPLRIEADYRFLGVGYRGGGIADDSQAGHVARLSAAYALGPAWSVAASGQLRSDTLADDLLLDGRLLVAYQGSTDVLLGERLLGTRPRLELGVQADAGGARALGSVALRDVLGLAGSEARVTHLQGLGVDVASSTDLSLAYRVSDALEVRLTDRIVWGRGHSLLVGLRSGFEHAELALRACQAGLGPCDPDAALALGRSTVTAQYEIPGGVSASAGSLRVGLDTRLPLGERWSVEGSVAQQLDLADAARNATVLTAGMTYDGDTLDASARYEVRFTGEGTKQVATAGATGALGAVGFGSVQLRYLDDPAADPRHGFGVSVAAAYRGDRVSLLTHHRGRLGSLQALGGRELEGDTRLTWTLTPALALQVGHAYQLLPDDALVDMLSLGVSAYAWEGGSVSAYGRALHDWGAGEVSLGAGIEVAQALGCGVYGVAGANLWEGIGMDHGATFARPGVYVRVDVVFDEQWRCGRGADGGER